MKKKCILENSIVERHSNVYIFYICCKTMLDKVDQLAKTSN